MKLKEFRVLYVDVFQKDKKKFQPKYANKNFPDNQFHNILRIFDVLLAFLFTAIGAMGDYYLW